MAPLDEKEAFERSDYQVGAKVDRDLISSSSLLSFTTGGGLRSTNGSSLVPINRFRLQRCPLRVNKFLEGHRDSTNSSPSSSPSDSTLSLKFDGQQFIGLLTHRNLPLWFPDYAIADGILTIKLERLRKLLQHMDLYLRLSPA